MIDFSLYVSFLQNYIFSQENIEEHYYELNDCFDYQKNDNYKNMQEMNNIFTSNQKEDIMLDVRISFFIFHFMFRKIIQKNFFFTAKRQMRKH